jgi:hypothetical protein
VVVVGCHYRSRQSWAVLSCAALALLAAALFSAPTAAAANEGVTASPSRTLVKTAHLGVGLHAPVGSRLKLYPEVTYHVSRPVLEALEARRPRVRLTYEARLRTVSRHGRQRTLARFVRRVRNHPAVATHRVDARRGRIRFAPRVLSHRDTARIKRAARRGKVVVVSRSRIAVHITDGRGQRVELRGEPRTGRRVLGSKLLNAEQLGGEQISAAAENRMTGVLVFDNVAGKYAGPITRTGYRVDYQNIYFAKANPTWVAYQCLVGCFGPKGEVSLQVGSSTAPALNLTVAYNERHDSTEPRVDCQVQAGDGSGLSPICAVNRTYAVRGLYMPEDSIPVPHGTMYSPSVDTYFVSAPGICSVSGVTCSEPPSTPKTVSKFEKAWDAWSMTGVFVYDAVAQQFAGPIARTGATKSTGDLFLTADADKWVAWRPGDGLNALFYKHPSGSVSLSTGEPTVGSPPRVPLNIKAIYNEKDQDKPRIECELDAVGFYKLPPTCAASHVDLGVYGCFPSAECFEDTVTTNTYFVSAPGICGVAGVTCSPTPPFYRTTSAGAASRSANVDGWTRRVQAGPAGGIAGSPSPP